MIQLRPMTTADFTAFLDHAIASYAEDNVKSGRWGQAGAREKSAASFASLLPEGLATPDHLLFNILLEDGKVGYVWVKLETDTSSAFLYQIAVYPEYQGRGYGTRALGEMENLLKEKGVRTLGLHVFAFNRGAQRLYKRLGFQVTSVNMQKDL